MRLLVGRGRERWSNGLGFVALRRVAELVCCLLLCRNKGK